MMTTKNVPNFVRDSNASLKPLTSQLSNEDGYRPYTMPMII